MYSDYEPPSQEVFLKIAKLAVSEKSDKPQEVVLNDVHTEGGSAIGENFTSVLKRFTIQSLLKDDNQIRTHKVIGKFLPLKTATTKWWNSMRVFEREVVMYNQILAKYEEESKISLAPRLYHSSNSCVLLEDLSSSGYVLNNAQECLNLSQMKLILLKLSSFHAFGHHLIASLGLPNFQKDFDVISEVANLGPALTNDPEIASEFKSIFRSMVKLSLRLLEPEYDTQTFNKLSEAMIQVEKDYPRVRQPLDHHFQVIGHGDLWNNNVLFKTDPTDCSLVTDVKFIDFQNSMRTRPTMDLVHLFYQSTTPDFRSNHMDGLLDFYHKELLRNLEFHGISPQIYPETQFRQDFKDCFIHGLYMGFVNIQAIFNADEVIDSIVCANRDETFHPNLSAKTKDVMILRLKGLIDEAQEFGVLRLK